MNKFEKRETLRWLGEMHKNFGQKITVERKSGARLRFGDIIDYIIETVNCIPAAEDCHTCKDCKYLETEKDYDGRRRIICTKFDELIFDENENQCIYGEKRIIDNDVAEQCPECGNEVWLKRDEKTGEWTRETGGKMNVSWIEAETKPPKDGEYYTIAEMQRDGIFYKKGDIVIEFDWYSDMLGWEVSRGSLSEWKVLAWAEIPLPDVPKEVEDRLVTYFDVKIAKRRNEMTKAEKMVLKTVHDLGTAVVSDVSSYTGLSPDDAYAAVTSLRKKRYLRVARFEWVLQKNEYGDDELVRVDCFWELTPEGKDAVQGIPDINEPMCIPITNIAFERGERQ